jgi:hypothetical protein
VHRYLYDKERFQQETERPYRDHARFFQSQQAPRLAEQESSDTILMQPVGASHLQEGLRRIEESARRIEENTRLTHERVRQRLVEMRAM